MDFSTSRFLLAMASGGHRPFPSRQLFDAFQTPDGILRASPGDLDRISGLHPSIRNALISLRDHPLEGERIDALNREGIRLVSYECSEYPAPLRQIPDAPPVLFVKGRIRPEDVRAVAVIGSRRAGAYGIAACERLVAGLVQHGFCIVSGMARGIDTVAHWSALEHGGRTVGVLGTGADVVYPRFNAALFEQVSLRGFLVSEFLPGTGARPENFPRRNRIISGLSSGVLVVEASERSGTMITVRLALEQGREVFSVPGDIRSPLSRGTHRLIQQGAKLVGCVEDILEELGHLPGPWANGAVRPSCTDSSQAEQESGALSLGLPGERPAEGTTEGGDTILQFLSDCGTALDTLVRRTGWPVERLSRVMTQLELSGRVRRMPGNRYAPTGG